MSDAGAPDSSNVDKLHLLTKYRTELLKPCDSTEKLLGRLDKLEHLLSSTLQGDRKLMEMSLQLSKEALISNELIKHSELDVRVSVASCISQIIRIMAPDEPYGDDHMKEFFELAITAFMRLCCMSGRAYSKAVCILHTMSVSQSCLMMLDLELYASVDHMFHLFLDGIRNKHPNEVFSSMEKIMTMIIHNNVDNDEFSLVLVRILLNRLRRENKTVSPVSFQLAENTFKNCSADLKKYLPEALRCSDFPIDDYAEVVVSCFQDATQRETMGSKDTVENVASPGEAGLAIEADLCNVMEANETQNPKTEENYNENRTTISHCSDDPDKVGKSMNVQQKQKPEEMHIGRKRNRRPSSLRKAEEGYDPHWMWIDWRSTKGLYKKKNKNTDYPTKTKKSKDFSPKPAGEYIGDSISLKPSKVREDFERNEEVSANKALEPKSEGKIAALELEAETGDFSVKHPDEIQSCSDKGQGSPTKIASVKKSGKEITVSEDLKDDAVVVTSVSQCGSISSQTKALSTEVSNQNPKGSVAHLKKRPASGSLGEEMIGCRIKVWWPLDQKFYKGTIAGYNDDVKYHQVEYDDGDIELLKLSRERWELLKKKKLSAHEQETKETSSSSKAK